jgi:solute carrier family 25 (mitochondrial thiamine pyrophosphate transporter), member 19
MEQPQQYPAWHNAVAGGAAGAGSRMATAPLDLIRIRRQLTPRTLYPSESITETWRKIVLNEGGIAALFRGNVSAIYLWIGYAAVQFSLYSRTRVVLEQQLDPQGKYPTATSFLSGALAGTCATLATYPFDLCRTTFAARGIESASSLSLSPQPIPFSSLVEPTFPSAAPVTTTNTTISPPKTMTGFSVQLYRQKGIRGFYVGAGPAVVQIIPYMGISFALYDRLTRNEKSVKLSGFAGSISGFLSKLIVYPLDTTKRRLQIQAFYGEEEQLFRKYSGLKDCALQIAKTEGVAGFYRGVVPSVLKTTISTGLAFALYRSSNNALQAIHDSGR